MDGHHTVYLHAIMKNIKKKKKPQPDGLEPHPKNFFLFFGTAKPRVGRRVGSLMKK